jgi:hypothetical protein
MNELLPAVEAAAVEQSEHAGRKSSAQQEAEDDTTPTAGTSQPEGAEESGSAQVVEAGIQSGPPAERDFSPKQKDRLGTETRPVAEAETGDEAAEVRQVAEGAVGKAPPVPDKEVAQGMEEKPLPAVPT